MPRRQGWAFAPLGAAVLAAALAVAPAAVRATERLPAPTGADGYRQAAQTYPVPLLDQLPERASANPRKVDFISIVLPLAIDANVDILKRRRRIEMLALYRDAGNRLDTDDRRWLNAMAERYGAAPGDLAALLRRVDIVPPSLVLAQAAEESGWGRSRFVRHGNALFGQRVWNGGGMVPRARPEGAGFAVRAYGSLVEAVRSYLHNLNTHVAYQEFRRRRAAMRRRGLRLDPLRLTGALANYSERREAYLDSIRSIISFNGLQVFDQILAPPGSVSPGA